MMCPFQQWLTNEFFLQIVRTYTEQRKQEAHRSRKIFVFVKKKKL